MSYPVTIDVDSIERDLAGVRYSHDELAGKHDELDRRQDRLEYDQAMHAEAVDLEIGALHQASTEIRADLTTTRTRIAYLAGQLDWIHHHVCVLAGLNLLDLHEVDDTVRRLAKQVQRAHAARDSLLTDHQRAHLHTQIERLGQLRGYLGWLPAVIHVRHVGPVARALQISRRLFFTSAT